MKKLGKGWEQEGNSIRLFRGGNGGMTAQERFRLAEDILRATDDGNLLNCKDLRLLEMAVTGKPNDYVYKLFKKLHKEVMANERN